MSRCAFAIAGFAILSACAGAEITTPPINVTPRMQADAVGLDVYARPRARGNPVPRFRGQETLVMRTRGTGALVVGAINAAKTDPEQDAFKYYPVTVNVK